MPSSYLGFVSNLPKFLGSLEVWRPKPKRKPKSKWALELERAREELVERRKAIQEEKERREKAMAAQRRPEERKRKSELRNAKHEERLLRAEIEKAEAEEKRKMKELERELTGMEDVGDEDESEGSKKDPYREIMKFMKSGACVRRAGRKKLPQYLDKDADVKFSDVAGLGKLQLELEEIVKFFTHADVYRRRGVKIPG